jgi:hypothetical protein
MPIWPEAPARLSMMKGWLSCVLSFWPSARAIMSTLPPAGRPTMILTGWSG